MTRSSAGSALRIGLVVVLLVGGTFVVGLAIVGAASQDTTTVAVAGTFAFEERPCVVSGPVRGLDATTAKVADALVSAAMAYSAESLRAARIALMAAMAASGLDATKKGTDGSLGLFQQPPSSIWGTEAELVDPVVATGSFLGLHLAVPSWRSAKPWAAAQVVMGPLWPASSFEADWGSAGQVLASVLANADKPGACGQGSGPLAGAESAHGLPVGYAVPAGTPPLHTGVVRFTLTQLGKPYTWGAAGPSAYDSSGLATTAWASVGIRLLDAPPDQQSAGQAVTPAELMAGDLVLSPGAASSSLLVAGHVGIYLGNGLVVSAIGPPDGVAVQRWDTFVAGGLVALRDPAPGQ